MLENSKNNKKKREGYLEKTVVRLAKNQNFKSLTDPSIPEAKGLK